MFSFNDHFEVKRMVMSAMDASRWGTNLEAIDLLFDGRHEAARVEFLSAHPFFEMCRATDGAPRLAAVINYHSHGVSMRDWESLLVPDCEARGYILNHLALTPPSTPGLLLRATPELSEWVAADDKRSRHSVSPAPTPPPSPRKKAGKAKRASQSIMSKMSRLSLG